MNFNVTLSSFQIDCIASVTADKVLETTKYQRNKEDWQDKEIQELKAKVLKRDSMLVEKDLIIERLRETLRKTRGELKELKGESNE